MKKLGLRFHDNDFGMAFIHALNIMVVAYHKSPDTFSKLTKENVQQFIDELLVTSYWLFQNQFSYDHDWDANGYLHVKEDRILFDDEIDAYLSDKETFLNGEFFWVDFEKGQVYIDKQTVQEALS